MKHLLLVGIIVAFVAIWLIVWRLRSDAATTISLNAAKHPAAFLTVATGVSTALFCASLYYTNWLLPEYNLTIFSTTLFFGIIISLVLAVWIPDVAGPRRKTHRGAAYVAVFIIPLFLLSLLAVPTLPKLMTIVIIGAVVAHLFMLYLLFFAPKMRRWFLLFQGLYLAVFFAVLLLLTYGV